MEIQNTFATINPAIDPRFVMMEAIDSRSAQTCIADQRHGMPYNTYSKTLTLNVVDSINTNAYAVQQRHTSKIQCTNKGTAIQAINSNIKLQPSRIIELKQSHNDKTAINESQRNQNSSNDQRNFSQSQQSHSSQKKSQNQQDDQSDKSSDNQSNNQIEKQNVQAENFDYLHQNDDVNYIYMNYTQSQKGQQSRVLQSTRSYLQRCQPQLLLSYQLKKQEQNQQFEQFEYNILPKDLFQNEKLINNQSSFNIKSEQNEKNLNQIISSSIKNLQQLFQQEIKHHTNKKQKKDKIAFDHIQRNISYNLPSQQQKPSVYMADGRQNNYKIQYSINQILQCQLNRNEFPQLMQPLNQNGNNSPFSSNNQSSMQMIQFNQNDNTRFISYLNNQIQFLNSSLTIPYFAELSNYSQQMLTNQQQNENILNQTIIEILNTLQQHEQNPQLQKNIVSQKCLICEQEIQQNADIKLTDCGHIFHSNCLENWLQYIPNCPNCNNVLNNQRQLVNYDEEELYYQQQLQASIINNKDTNVNLNLTDNKINTIIDSNPILQSQIILKDQIEQLKQHQHQMNEIIQSDNIQYIMQQTHCNNDNNQQEKGIKSISSDQSSQKFHQSNQYQDQPLYSQSYYLQLKNGLYKSDSQNSKESSDSSSQKQKSDSSKQNERQSPQSSKELNSSSSQENEIKQDDDQFHN